MARKRRRVRLQCPNCKEEHIVVTIGEAFDEPDECEECGHTGSFIVLEDDGQNFSRAQCVYCNHVVPAGNDFDSSTKCPNCGKSGAYVMLEEGQSF